MHEISSIERMRHGFLRDIFIEATLQAYVRNLQLNGANSFIGFRRNYFVRIEELLRALIYLYFSIFAPSVRPATEAYKPYIQQFPMLGYKNENKLLDIRLSLDVMTADEVRWALYRIQEIRACWVSTWHGFIAYFDCVKSVFPPSYPASGGTQAAKQQNVLVEEYFCGGTMAEAPSHLLTETWTNSPEDTESRDIPSGFHLPVAPVMPLQALLDLIASEATREDLEDSEFRRTIRDLLRKHYRDP
ncbi:hypothetical protein M9H77_25915 [Catharanthus roseus]|uniref:Uncharacterized protein n=1 Tax=Catharanthus roseus TaxID=4058 RepID=A0ACC0AAX4_CATRO|nr:hypothetical protein M9H77_25915 [Catharanthus roseus]